MAGAIRVGAGRNSVKSNLASTLTTRNHLLDHNFSAKTLMIEEKKKKKKDKDENEDSDDSIDSSGYQDELLGEGGVCYVERVGVSTNLFSKDSIVFI